MIKKVLKIVQSMGVRFNDHCRKILNPGISRLIDSIKGNQLTFINKNALCDLLLVVSRLEKKGIAGAYVETGCALGGSAIAISKAKSKDRQFYVYDVFSMIPPPSEKDGEDVHKRYEIIKAGKAKGLGTNNYYGYEENLFEKVKENFNHYGIELLSNNVHLVKGLFQDTMKIDFPVALAHIDCDWYESVLTCLTRIVPELVVGGTLVIDDYYSWSGCKKAVDEYFHGNNRENFRFVRKNRLHIIKKR